MKMKTIVSSLLLTGLAATSQAQLAGHNVILVHGFQADNILNQPASSAEIVQNGESYWSEYWNTHADARLDWDSSERIEGGTAQRLYDDAVTLSLSGLCSTGCVLVTHSTGDLVARYFVENQADWLEANGYQPLNILTSLDFAGAGGGTEIADTVVSVVTSNNAASSLAVSAVEWFMGGTLDSNDDLGVLYDLQPANARNLATASSTIPRLRFAGAGNDYYGLTGGFITGTDDGVVPTHSSCGAVSPKAYDSCSKNVEFDGEKDKGDVNGPSNLFYNHFAVLMGDDTHHNGTIGTQDGVQLTYVDNNFDAGGIDVDFDTKTYDGWFADYLYVKNSKGSTMSEKVYETLNN